jgi:hypothetical protein
VNFQLDISGLRRQVEREIDEYVYQLPEGAIGNPWPAEKVEQRLRAFRSALVEPYWANVIDDDKRTKRCIVIADEKRGTLLVFEPEAQKFMLAMQSKLKEGGLISFGVDGDAVGCFLAQ